jgi:hypothetical protein
LAGRVSRGHVRRASRSSRPLARPCRQHGPGHGR